MDVYILHDASVLSRKENVQNLKNTFQKIHDVNDVYVIDKFNNKDINQELVKKLLRTQKPENENKLDEIFERFSKPLNINNISNYLKHFTALEKISETKKSAIIVEDDVLFDEESLCKHINLETFQNYDFIAFGQPFPKVPLHKIVAIKNFNSEFVLLPSCESYFINVDTASRVKTALLPIVFETNISLSLALNKNNITAHKYYPNIFIDGSKTGKYTSSINTNNILHYNSKYNELYKHIQSNSVNIDVFDKLYSEAEYNESADLIYLKGLYYLKANKVTDAKVLFDEAYSKYCKDGCKLNKSSSFMNNYLSFFRVMQ